MVVKSEVFSANWDILDFFLGTRHELAADTETSTEIPTTPASIFSTPTTVGSTRAAPGLPLGIYTNHYGKGCSRSSRGTQDGGCRPQNGPGPMIDQVRIY